MKAALVCCLAALRLACSQQVYISDDFVINPLRLTDVAPGHAVKKGTELRILCVGDSITEGFLSDKDGGDGNGYLLELRDDLSEDKVVFAGTRKNAHSTMTGGYYGAWSGKTIQFIADNIGPSLQQRPNLILLHAGTNDMAGSNRTSTEGSDPQAAAIRLGNLIDEIIEACPDAVLLVAMIINSCEIGRMSRTKLYQSLIPGVVQPRLDAGHHVLAVDFTSFPTTELRDCIHPTNDGYRKFGDYWYDFITQIPQSWISAPVGHDPQRPPDEEDGANVSRTSFKTDSALLMLISLGLCATSLIKALG